MSATLYLIPTPINDSSSLDEETKSFVLQKLESNACICVEEIKEGRRRWLRFGFPREAIENFVLYNEHTRDDEKINLLKLLQSGRDVLLMSDCGLPAFCDPGADLVSLCHNHNIRVSSTNYPNSISLSLALSGMNHDRFMFEGFLPVKNPDRKDSLKKILKSNLTTIIMDTPYRLKSTLEELAALDSKQMICLCLDLNKEEELILRGAAGIINKKIEKQKREFVIVIGKGL